MEKMDRKKGKEVKGDDQYIGGKNRNGDGGVLSWENDSQLVDNLKGKKKKKNKHKGSKKKRDECVAIGHAVENEGGDAYLGEMDINGEKGVMVDEHVELKKKKGKEKRSEKERDEYQSSGHAAENEGDQMDIGDHEHVELKKKKKKKKKEKEKRIEKERDEYQSSGHASKNEGDEMDIGDHEHVELKKKKKKKKGKEKRSERERDEYQSTGHAAENEGDEMDIGDHEVNDGEKSEVVEETSKKKRKREKEKTDEDSMGAVVTDKSLDKEVPEEVRKKRRKTGSGKNKKLAKDHGSCEGSSTIGMESNDSEMQISNNGQGKKKKQPEKIKAKKGKKKVSFACGVEVFPTSSDLRNPNRNNEQNNLVRGKRFTIEEDKILEEAIHHYIEVKGLGENGLDMIRNCKYHPELKGCWTEIAKALPHRPRSAIYCRSQITLRRGEKRKWSEEDCELLRSLHEKHGNNWKLLAEEFDRNRYHVKDTWRRLKLLNKRKGHWSQNEYQNLFDLVNTDLRLKIFEDEEKKNKYGMLRDNIHWSAISDTLETRTAPICCMKWYNQLSSPMVVEGEWADSDDYRLVNELFSLDASCMEDVDWDNILEHRPGYICRKRWNQMVLHIGNHSSMSFSEQVEILAKRYNPDLIEVREAWDNKPYVDI